MHHELLVNERKGCSGIEKNKGGMGVYEKHTHEHFGIIRNLFRGGVVETATLRSLRWLGSLAWGLRWRVVRSWCIGGAALPW
jgi:hypothetical protein